MMMPTAAHASRPKPGEVANGDRAFFWCDERRFVAGVVDGLGHGPRAEEAALKCVATIEAAGEVSIEDLFDLAHEALRGTRGSALTVIMSDGDRVAMAGVGNVALRVVRGPPWPFITTPGIVGGQMRGVRVTRVPVDDARVVLHSDGVSHRFDSTHLERGTPDEACARLLAEHAGPIDDATVLVVDLTRDRRSVALSPRAAGRR